MSKNVIIYGNHSTIKKMKGKRIMTKTTKILLAVVAVVIVALLAFLLVTNAADKQQTNDQQRKCKHHKDAGNDLCYSPCELKRQSDGLNEKPRKDDNSQ